MDSPTPPSRPKRATIVDVAAAAGVSRALVSIVMRDVPGASDTTRTKVRAVADELGYRPDQRARSLRQRRTRLLGVAFELGQDFHTDLLQELYREAAARGYQLVLSAVALGRDEIQVARELSAERCEGLILLSSSLSDEQLRTLDEILPTATIGSDTTAVDSVLIDDAGGIDLAMDYLAQRGHRRIVHIDGGDAPSASARRSAYIAAMARLGIAEHTQILFGGETERDGAVAARRLVAELPTAVLGFNDRVAVGAMSALGRIGVLIPSDVSVIGFDNSAVSSLPQFALTSIEQDPRAMAVAAIDQMHNSVTSESGRLPKSTTRLAARLIERDSVADARR